MCGRFTQTKSWQEIHEFLSTYLGERDDRAAAPNLAQRFNIAPTQDVAVARLDDSGRWRLSMLRWGLVPRWARDRAIGQKLINARAETVATKPSFRDAFRHRRCLVLADGFYEWGKHGDQRQPFHITLAGGGPFAFAGLWERWSGGGGAPLDQGPLESCTIITTEANARLRPIHARMPVILDPGDTRVWLTADDPAPLTNLLGAAPEDALTAVPVSAHVNNPRHDDPECVAALAAI